MRAHNQSTAPRVPSLQYIIDVTAVGVAAGADDVGGP
jgi:hypothetical protein